MMRFTFQSLPSRVVFGEGSLEGLPDEVALLGASRALVLCTPGQRAVASAAATRLGERAAGVYDRIVMHVPVEMAAAARDEAVRLGADCCIAIGGGSTIGLGKAIALAHGMPIIAVPTTYAGSEMTPIWGLTEGGVKRTGRDPKVLPRTVIYDPRLTLSLPAALSGTSGMNAIAHCVEALYAVDGNPIVSLMAEEGIRALAGSLPGIAQRPRDLAARGAAMYGSWLAGYALGSVGMALHHKLCHTLGGSFNLPHAEVHTAILPHAVAFNRAAAPEAMARIARAMAVSDPAAGLFDLATSLGARMRLADLGMRMDGIDRAAELATSNPYANPQPVTRQAVQRLLQDAYEGRRPTA